MGKAILGQAPESPLNPRHPSTVGLHRPQCAPPPQEAGTWPGPGPGPGPGLGLGR